MGCLKESEGFRRSRKVVSVVESRQVEGALKARLTIRIVIWCGKKKTLHQTSTPTLSSNNALKVVTHVLGLALIHALIQVLMREMVVRTLTHTMMMRVWILTLLQVSVMCALVQE